MSPLATPSSCRGRCAHQRRVVPHQLGHGVGRFLHPRVVGVAAVPERIVRVEDNFDCRRALGRQRRLDRGQHLRRCWPTTVSPARGGVSARSRRRERSCATSVSRCGPGRTAHVASSPDRRTRVSGVRRSDRGDFQRRSCRRTAVESAAAGWRRVPSERRRVAPRLEGDAPPASATDAAASFVVLGRQRNGGRHLLDRVAEIADRPAACRPGCRPGRRACCDLARAHVGGKLLEVRSSASRASTTGAE